jgi:2-desacetyl-2-hydroxyethyl bacteriochlorophyllide A dehydrogenase
MKAAIFYNERDIRIEDVMDPVIGPNDVLVAPQAVGLCGSDYHIYAGHWKVDTPLILGHEFTGKVVRVGGKVENFSSGDRVVVEPAVTCGNCFYCNGIDTNNYFCENRPTVGFTENGAFAELVKVPEKGLHLLPEELDFEKGAFVEPLACALRGSDRSEVQPGDNVIILGAGPIGLLLLLLTRLRGAAKIIVTEKNRARKEMAAKLGADLVIDPDDTDIGEESKKLFSGREADVVIEAVGTKNTTEQAFNLTRPGGRVCIVGLCPQGTPVSISDAFEAFYLKELTIVGSSCSPRGTFERAIRLLAADRIEVDAFITHRFPLEEVEKALLVGIEGVEPAVKIIINSNNS